MNASSTLASRRAAKRSATAVGRGASLARKGVRLAFETHHTGARPPGAALPAVAVLGRSNVGKSSLLNALLGIPVARVSQTPGRTQALFWYRVDDVFDVVDCPGYGYAKAAKEKRALFSEMIESFLVGPPAPLAALLLVDGRIEPQESDRSMALFLRNAGVPTLVVATKWDAVKPSERVRRRRALAAEYEDAPGGEFLPRPLLPVSSETGENLHDLARRLRARLDPSAKENDHAST
jgi:GTP-binding protein